MIVNSSPGGGSKDTWVLEEGAGRRRPRPCPRRAVAAAAMPDLRYGADWTSQQQQQQQ